MLSITVIVIIVAAVSGLVNVSTEEQQLLNTMIVGADQLSKGITSATWHAMLDDHRAPGVLLAGCDPTGTVEHTVAVRLVDLALIDPLADGVVHRDVPVAGGGDL